MSFIAYIIVFAVMAIVLYFVLRKQGSVGRLNKALNNKDYETVINYCEKESYQKAVGVFNCELYRLKAIYFSKGDAAVLKELLVALKKDYTQDQKKQLLDIYYHIFLQKENREYCDTLMEVIDTIEDENFKKCQKWSYDIMFNHCTDYIEEMDLAIENKQYEGFDLGVVAYMIGLSYYYKESYESARSYFYTCISCFRPHDLYVDLAKKYVNELSDKIGDQITI